MEYFIGIDGGGTKTIAVLVNGDGKVIRSLKIGPTNYSQLGKAATLNVIEKLIKEISAGMKVSSACLGLAGLGRANDLIEFNADLNAAKLADKIEAVSDGLIALYAATRGEAGVILIAGTGAIAWGSDGKGKLERADGWGYLLGDRGSGFDLSRSAMVAAFQAYDGRGEATSLLKAMLDYFGVNAPDDVIRLVYNKDSFSISRIAGFASRVFEQAQLGDRVSISLIEDAARQLSASANAVMRRLGISFDRIYVSGGLFQQPLLRSEVEKMLDVSLSDLPLPPVLGAVIRAAHNYGLKPGDEFFDNLAKNQRSDIGYRARTLRTETVFATASAGKVKNMRAGYIMEISEYDGNEEDVISLWNKSLPADPVSEKIFRYKILFNPNFVERFCLVARRDGKNIAFTFGQMDGAMASIDVLFVDPDNRRRKVGTEMVTELINRFRSAGVKRVRLGGGKRYFFPGVDVNNTPALFFFRSLGFRELDREAVSMNMSIMNYAVEPDTLNKEKELAQEGIEVGALTPEFIPSFFKFLEKEFPEWREDARWTLEAFPGDLPMFTIARKGKDVIGYAQFGSDGVLERFGPFGVKSEYRNKGLGSVIFAKTLVQMKARGCKNAWFMWGGGRNVHFYERHGMVETRRYAQMVLAL